MRAEEFQNQLYQAQDLISKENFDSAQKILNELKEVEKNGEFDYSLTHKLYQLISNLESLINQKTISLILKQLSETTNEISLKELEENLFEKENLHLEPGILRREIEILILRGILDIKIEGDTIKF
jgi:hypothetical protein